MADYSKHNAQAVLAKVNEYIARLEEKKKVYEEAYHWGKRRYYYCMREVYRDLSIFDWWTDRLSLSRLKEMRQFLTEAIDLGFTGYVCFKVGVSGCANGMWAHKKESENGYSPENDDFLYRSFTTDYTYWDILYKEDIRLSELAGLPYDGFKSVRALKKYLREPVKRAERTA